MPSGLWAAKERPQRIRISVTPVATGPAGHGASERRLPAGHPGQTSSGHGPGLTADR